MARVSVGTEKRQKLLDSFLPVVQMTKAGEEVKELHYDDSRNVVHVVFCTGYQYAVNVACDSELMMLLDVLRYLTR